MVSTRSGRVVSAADTAGGRVTRARSKKEAEGEEALERIEEVGQPEVSSPAPSLLFSKQSKGTPAGAFGSPAAFGMAQTPVQDPLLGTPLNERVVKTVGRTPAAATHTPAAATPGPAPTPSAKAVKQIASVPLPDDAINDDTEAFASSEDEPAGPASPNTAPSQPPAGPTSSRMEPRAKAGSPGRIFGFFALASILATFLVALILAPCASPELFTIMNPATYQPICKGIASHYGQAAEVVWRVQTEAAVQAIALRNKLPPPAQDLLAKAWEPVQQAHQAALPLLSSMVAQLEERLAPLCAQAADVLSRSSRELYTRLAPALDAVLAKLRKRSGPTAVPPPADPTPAPARTFPPYNFPISQESFLDIIDPQQHNFALELWHNSGRQVAAKRKALAWLLAYSNEEDRAAASGALFSDASSLVHLDGASYSAEDSAGVLQQDLVNFLRGSPGGLVIISNPTEFHVNSVAVLNAALSESGHLQMNGVPVATDRAFYVVLAEASQADSDQAVKDKLVDALTSTGAENAEAIARSFRRRLDAVLRVRPQP